MPPRIHLSGFPTLRPPKPRIWHTSPLPRPPCRLASQFGGRRPNYNRFDRVRQVRTLWQTSPGFRNGVFVLSAGGGVFYVSNLEKVPISERRRFNCVSEKLEKQQSQAAFRLLMGQFGKQILPPNHPDSLAVVSKFRSIYYPFLRSSRSVKHVSAISAPNTRCVHCIDREEEG